MSKPIKEMMMRVYRDQFEGTNEALLVDIRGIEANDNNALRTGLAEKGIRVTVVRNTLARGAFSGTGLEPLADLMKGPSAVVYGSDSVVSVAREMIDWAKKVEKLDLKGAVMDGLVFGPSEIKALSEYPTQEEAQAQIVQVVLGPAGQVIGAATSAGSAIAGILEALEEKLSA